MKTKDKLYKAARAISDDEVGFYAWKEGRRVYVRRNEIYAQPSVREFGTVDEALAHMKHIAQELEIERG